MPIEGPGFDLLGMTITRTHPVDGIVHLELDQGLSALYGINGAGKTTLLRLVARALAGEYPEKQLSSIKHAGITRQNYLDLHIRLREPLRGPDDPDWPLGTQFLMQAFSARAKELEQELRDRAAEVAFDLPSPDMPILERLVLLGAFQRGWFDGAARHRLQPAMQDLATRHVPAMLESARAGRITLRATGTSEVPRWQAFLACSRVDPLSAQALDEVDDVYRSWRPIIPVPAVAPPDSGDAFGFGPLGDSDALSASVPPPAPRPIPEHLSLVYWGSNHDPAYSTDIPSGLQTASNFLLGEVVGGHWLHRPAVGEYGEWESGFSPATVVGNVAGEPSPDQEMLTHFLTSDPDEMFEYGTDDFEPEFAADITRRVERANELVAAILPGRATVDWVQPTYQEMMRGYQPRWSFNGLDLNQLSAAQRKWVMLACSTAMAQNGPVVVLIDEPEAGLHRAVEHRLGPGLSSWSRTLSAAVVVATHSPALLSSPYTAPLFVTSRVDSDAQARRRPGIRVRPVPLSVLDGNEIRRSAIELGLTVGDLWAMSRVTVVVEGIHDAWVFKALLRDDLDCAAAGLYPIHGATRLKSLADAQLMVAGSEAAIVIVLDDLNLDDGRTALASIRRAVNGGDPDEVRTILETVRQAGRKNDSLLFLHQFASEAIKVNSLHRISLHGLSYPDVICYLDPDTVLTNPVPWDELVAQWSEEAYPNQPKNLKGWLRRQGYLPDDAEAIDNAVELAALRMRDEGRPLHPDVMSLGLAVQELGRLGPPQSSL